MVFEERVCAFSFMSARLIASCLRDTLGCHRERERVVRGRCELRLRGSFEAHFTSCHVCTLMNLKKGSTRFLVVHSSLTHTALA